MARIIRSLTISFLTKPTGNFLFPKCPYLLPMKKDSLEAPKVRENSTMLSSYCYYDINLT